MDTLQIRDRVYHLDEVLLYLDIREEGLRLSLHAEGKTPEAVVALNCLTLPGARRIGPAALELEGAGAGGLNELAESVVRGAGETLELDSLRLAFGPPMQGCVPVSLDAVCHGRDEEEIPVRGRFSARIVREPQAAGGPQLDLHYEP
jgi:hypothetical protein